MPQRNESNRFYIFAVNFHVGVELDHRIALYELFGFSHRQLAFTCNNVITHFVRLYRICRSHFGLAKEGMKKKRMKNFFVLFYGFTFFVFFLRFLLCGEWHKAVPTIESTTTHRRALMRDGIRCEPFDR